MNACCTTASGIPNTIGFLCLAICLGENNSSVHIMQKPDGVRFVVYLVN